MNEQNTVYPEEDKYLAVGQSNETGLYHGLVYRNHKTPSGCDRWLLALSTNQGFETERAAGDFINCQFPEVKQLDLEKLSNKNELSTIPALPKGAMITVMTYNGHSYDPAPKEDLPRIEVTMGGKRSDIRLNAEQIGILEKRKVIELDSETDDPNLSCRYTHFYVPIPVATGLSA